MITGCRVRSKDDNAIPANGVVKREIKYGDTKEQREVEYEYRDSSFVRYTLYYTSGRKQLESRKDSSDQFWNVSEFYESGQIKRNYLTAEKGFSFEQQWYENGQLGLDFKRNDASKDFGIRYYMNGRKKEEFEFQNEQRHGKWTEWDSLGNVTRNEFYRKGKRIAHR